jgi:alcohol dehydrogenase class IV
LYLLPPAFFPVKTNFLLKESWIKPRIDLRVFISMEIFLFFKERSIGMVPIQTFSLDTRIIFGPESIRELPSEGRALGGKVLLVTGKSGLRSCGLLQRVELLLKSSGFEIIPFSEVEPEPSLETVRKGLALARENQADWVIGLGGGSAMDVAKVIAVLYDANNDVEYYFNGGKIAVPGIPIITIPTTAGSGAEVTFNAVLSDPASQTKKSIRDPLMVARVTIVDPLLMVSAPPHVTVNSGLDALIQAIEAFTSKGSGPLTDIYALSAVERLGGNILKVYNDGNDVQARTEMAMGSLMAGIALSNARLGAVHGMAHSIGIRTGKPHGLICAVLLIPVMRFNLSACYEKYALVAKALGTWLDGDPIDVAAMGMKSLLSLERKLAVPQRISQLGLTEDQLSAVVEESLTSGSTRANPREVKHEDLMNILTENF